ncbi:proton-coupled folate transporter-like [Diadema setosum]|uniref:proton-coupled folate transporter-like n=1 Tax=Diadema setosum TaxID=31175 RepID=UPI003B3A71C4
MIRVVLFIFMTGLVMQFPVTQHLIVDMACKRLDYADEVCSDLSKHPEAEDAVQAEASRIMIWQSVFCDIPGAMSALILGAQSDKVGRKPIMLMPIVGSTLLVFTLLLGSLLQKASMMFLLTSSVVLGLSGGIGTFMTAVTNFVTDSTPEEQRTERLSKTMPFMGLGMIAGFISSGFLTQTFGVTAVYLIDFLMMISVVYVVVFHLEEPSRESSADDGRIKDKPIGVVASARENLTAGVRVFTSQKSRTAKLQLAVLTISGMVGMAIMVAEGNLLMLYTKKAPFSFTPTTFSLHTALKNGLGIVGQAVGTTVFFRVVGERSIRNDFILLQIASLGGCAIHIFTGLASSSALLWFSTVLVMFCTPAQSASGSIVSRLVSPQQKGAFMSLGTFLNTLAVPVASFVLNNIYSASVQTRPGLVFLFIATVHAVVFSALTYVVMFTLDRQAKDEKKAE